MKAPKSIENNQHRPPCSVVFEPQEGAEFNTRIQIALMEILVNGDPFTIKPLPLAHGVFLTQEMRSTLENRVHGYELETAIQATDGEISVEAWLTDQGEETLTQRRTVTIRGPEIVIERLYQGTFGAESHSRHEHIIYTNKMELVEDYMASKSFPELTGEPVSIPSFKSSESFSPLTILKRKHFLILDALENGIDDIRIFKLLTSDANFTEAYSASDDSQTTEEVIYCDGEITRGDLVCGTKRNPNNYYDTTRIRMEQANFILIHKERRGVLSESSLSIYASDPQPIIDFLIVQKDKYDYRLHRNSLIRKTIS